MPVKVPNSNQILSLLENFTLTRWEDISADIASDFRRRRIEKNLTRKQIAEKANVALPTVARFEQRGLISLEHLIPKYQTLEELDLIKKNQNKKKATGK